MSEPSVIRWDRSDDGVVMLTIDGADETANLLDDGYCRAMDTVLNRLTEERDSTTGVIVSYAKGTSGPARDVESYLAAYLTDAATVADRLTHLNAQLRRLETLGLPVVAAIDGPVLGGALEIALACHRRIAVDSTDAELGLPDVTLGLLPGVGGVVRTVRLLGVERALDLVLLKGQRHAPRAALEIGLIDELVSGRSALAARARAWILEHPENTAQPWDRPGYALPGGDASDPARWPRLLSLASEVRRLTRGANVPAPRAIVASAVEGAQVDVDSALLIETRYATSLLVGQTAKNLMRSTLVDLPRTREGGSRPLGHEPRTIGKLGVVGAGLMGAGIAYIAAKAGIEVVVEDISVERAARAVEHAELLESRARKRGLSTPGGSAAVLDRIRVTDTMSELAEVDFIVEAVFEDHELKRAVFAELDGVTAGNPIFGSNTSTLPITQLADSIRDPATFIGVHFFSPVDRMPLLEIVRGKRTADKTVAAAYDFALQIGKTPIVVNDSRGFFTSRVFLRFQEEAATALGEGIEARTIEQAGLQAGYPAPPLQLFDDLTLTLPRSIQKANRAAALAQNSCLPVHGSEHVLDRMINDLGRPGRAARAGFYDYNEDGTRAGLWPGLRDAFKPRRSSDAEFEDLKERMLFTEALESVRCLDEGVLTSVADGNIGSLLGIGYPQWTGGVFQYINQYEGGLPGFMARAGALAQRYGERFSVPASLAQRAAAAQPYT